MFEMLWKKYNKVFIAILVICISGVPHAVNMFGFPYYENDEGTYMSQAWSLLRFGELAPYTYWYDHAPAGWFLIALWVVVVRGFFAFGTSVDTGRVLMLVLHIVTSVLLFYVAKKLTKRTVPGLIAVTIYSLSPLGIYFQRRVLLDNIMTFWIFLSLAILFKKKLQLGSIVVSSIATGVAILTKENAVFFVPALLYLLIVRVSKSRRLFAVFLWMYGVVSVSSLYVLYALLKKEFFPQGFLNTNTEHVSLMDTLKFHMGRGDGLPFWYQQSDFYGNMQEWINKDLVIVVLGVAACLLGIILSFKVKALRLPTMLSVLFIFFLVRGGIVLGFYIVPLIPIFALLIGILLDYLLFSLSINVRLYKFTSICSILALSIIFLLESTVHFTKNETAAQVSAVKYIKENIAEDAVLVIDDSIFVDLHEPGYINTKVFPNAEWSWKVEKDREIKTDLLRDDWKNIGYIVLTHEIVKQMHNYENDLIEKAFNNSDKIADFTVGSTSYIDLNQLISTNGDWMSVYKRRGLDTVYLTESWQNYKNNFIHSYGQVVDPANGNTTSEGQSYAMLRAVWMNDKETFEGVWQWTKDHMQHRGDKLVSWLWGRDNDGERLLDSNSASDADIDIALALIFASNRWNDVEYFEEARLLLSDIWDKEVVLVGDRHLLMSGPNSMVGDFYLVNPSYFSPAHFRVFAQVDNSHHWEKLAEDSYYFLFKIVGDLDSRTKLPPDWILVSNTEEVRSAEELISNSSFYGYDAFRVLWRVALDYKWFGTSEALAYLNSVHSFFEGEWKNGGNINTVYTLGGDSLTDFSEVSTLTGPLSVFSITDFSIAVDIYKKFFTRIDENYNYYDQNWAWFATALYTDNLPNLWNN